MNRFQMPKSVRIAGRTSSVTNSFVNGVTPTVVPSEDEVIEALEVLGLSLDELHCAYCGDGATEWDHFRPIVREKRPTGYITEIANLVPACGKCNQSKGSKRWKEWITSSAKKSPFSRGIVDLQERIQRLEAFESWREPTSIDYEQLLGPELWKRYWEAHDHLLGAMRECETTADEVRVAVQRHLQR